MSYQERQAMASLVSTILIAVFYSVYVLQRYPAGSAYSPDAFHFWGLSILIFIPVSIVANIVIHIVFSIAHTMATNEKDKSFSDERDKLIALKASRNSLYVFTVGFLLAMGSLVIELPPSVMFIILIVSGILTGIAGALSELYFYRRGF